MIKKLRSLFRQAVAIAAVALTAALAPVAPAADWGESFGLGNNADDLNLGGSGVILGVIASVQSNSVYYITSAKSSGAPSIDEIWLRQDSVAGTIDYLVATNSWTCASNQPAGTNIIWLTSTNLGLATNDLLVLRNRSSDSYQLLVLGGGSTDGAGLVYTNALGQCGVKLWTTPTNTISRNDTLYKMARQTRYTPLAMSAMTNQLSAVVGDHFGATLLLSGKAGQPIRFRGRQGWPSAIVMTYSNSAALQVEGEYRRHPRP